MAQLEAVSGFAVESLCAAAAAFSSSSRFFHLALACLSASIISRCSSLIGGDEFSEGWVGVGVLGDVFTGFEGSRSLDVFKAVRQEVSAKAVQ